MIIYRLKKIHPVVLIIALWFLFSAPFFLFGKTPFPSDYQVNFFSPWASYPEMKGPVKNNAQPDIITQIYPWRYFSIQELKQGNLPLWNPYSFAGTPHLANYQSAVLFPLNILFFLPLSFIDVWSILVLFQPLIAGLLMYLFARVLRLSRPASLVSSLSFMFCGFIVTWMGYATLGYAIIPLPAALYCVVRYAETNKFRWLILLSITFVFSFFAGHFQTSIYFSLGVVLYVLYNLIFSKRKRPYFSVLLFIFIGMLLVMPQLLPSIELYSLSFRSELFKKMEAIPFQYLSTLFSPDFFGNPVTRNDWFGHYAEWNGYVGVVSFSFAILAILFVRNRSTYFFIGLGILSFLLAYDTPLLSLLVHFKIPVLSTSAASRIIVLFSFSTAVLAGYGFDYLLNHKNEKRKFVVWLISILIVFSLFSIFGITVITDTEITKIAIKNSLFPLGTIILLSIIVAIFLKVKNKTFLTFFVFVIIALCTFEMYRFASKWQNFDPKNNVYAHVPVTDFYNKHNHYDRAVGLSGGEDAVYYKVPILSGYDPLYKAEFGEFIQFVGQGKISDPDRSVVNFPYKGKYTSQALDFLGIHMVVHKVSDGTFSWAFPFYDYAPDKFTKIYDDPYYQVFQNNTAFERAFIAQGVIISEHIKIPQLMFGSDLRKTAFIEEKPEGIVGGASGSATITKYSANNLSISVNVDKNALLVITDNYYPGWKAKVNGINEKIYKTNYSFRGVFVPKGNSIVEFNFIPMSFMIGIYLSFSGGLIMFVYWFFIYTKIRK